MIEIPRQTWQIRKPAVRSGGGLVAAQHLDAAKVGADVLEGGGNAVDAALATSLALAALEPWMSGLGGGGFMVVAKGDGAPVEVIDFGMVAPAALDPAAYPLAEGRDDDLFGWPAVREQRNVHGPLAIATPRQAAGLELAWRAFASLPWADLCAPAIALAERGLPLSWYQSLKIAMSARDIRAHELARDIYLPGGLPPVPEDGHLPLGRLAATLRRLAEAGARDLIDGELAHALCADVQAAGGVLAPDDLRRHPAERVPALPGELHGAILHAAPGLSAGPTLLHALELTRGRIAPGAPGPAAYVAWAEALLAAYERRLATMGDVDDRRDPASTTHLCVVDRHGTMVSLTQTLLSSFGSKVISPQTGILLNNGIMWFDPRPGRPNSMAPGKRPLSNMCPVIATRGGRPWFALGASGGRRIMPAVLQLSSMLIDGGLDLEGAFHTPRIDVSGEPHVTADQALASEVLAALGERFEVQRAAQLVYPNNFACPSAVLHDAERGDFAGATDPVNPAAGVAVARET